jgi:hypothetical protein
VIAKTFFLMKIIYRIGIQSLRQEKSFRENLAGYRIFFTLRQPGRPMSVIASKRRICFWRFLTYEGRAVKATTTGRETTVDLDVTIVIAH